MHIKDYVNLAPTNGL